MFPAGIMSTWRGAFDDAIKKFGGWPSLEKSDDKLRIPIERIYGVMVGEFKSDSLFKATVQPDDKNSKQNVLLVRSYLMLCSQGSITVIVITNDKGG